MSDIFGAWNCSALFIHRIEFVIIHNGDDMLIREDLSRVGQQEPNQLALSMEVRLGVNALQLRAYSFEGHPDPLCNLAW
jgi:hypothetical protein